MTAKEAKALANSYPERRREEERRAVEETLNKILDSVRLYANYGHSSLKRDIYYNEYLVVGKLIELGYKVHVQKTGLLKKKKGHLEISWYHAE